MTAFVVTVRPMSYPSDLTDDQWELLEPVFITPGKRGSKHGADLCTVVDAMLYAAHAGCQSAAKQPTRGRDQRLASRIENQTNRRDTLHLGSAFRSDYL